MTPLRQRSEPLQTQPELAAARPRPQRPQPNPLRSASRDSRASRWGQQLGKALLMGLATLALHATAQAARLALVVGNDNYSQVAKLSNAVRDAELMAQTLSAAGFQVTLLRNLDRQALYAAVDRLQGQVNSGDEVAFFFAGHGVQLGNDQVLLPVDIQADDERKLLREGVPLLYVQDALKSARLAMLVVDACRDNPFPKTGTRSLGDTRGLRPPEPAKGQVVILSAGRGEKALDSVPGEQAARNGLFTWEFAKVLRTPGLDVLSALRRVRDQVEDRAASISHRQRPSLVDDLRGQFYLYAPPAGPATPAVPALVPGESSEDIAWRHCSLGSATEDCREYLRQYPQGRFVALATLKLQQLERLPAVIAPSSPQTSVPAAGAIEPPAVAGSVALRVGQRLTWRITDLYTGNSHDVSMRITASDKGKRIFDDGVRIESSEDAVQFKGNSALGLLDSIRPPRGWASALDRNQGNLRTNYRTASGFDVDLKGVGAGDTVQHVLAGRSFVAQRIRYEGLAMRLNNMFGSPAQNLHAVKVELLYVSEIDSVVSFTASMTATGGAGSPLNARERIELLSVD